MEDVIFGGSSADRRGARGGDDHLRCGDEPFPGEFARYEEIQISRRLFRDGNSEYYINQERVRLKDIHDLFLDTGVGNRMYSFIEQGRISKIVDAKPVDRRSLIEEAAGISRYNARREEAQSKLETTEQNLERASEVTEELAGATPVARTPGRKGEPLPAPQVGNATGRDLPRARALRRLGR
jgi:chromosome segregation protein